MRRWMLLVLCLVLVSFSAVAEEPVPQTGALLEEFEVVAVGQIHSLNARTVQYRHVKTGASVLFIQNDDPNLGFAIGFHTEPTDDTGMLHILEHASCAASEKYPGRDVFFDAISQAYLTGLNAWTSLSSTIYYATSLSQEQLYTMTDFYLDCSFHSALRTQPNYFFREGWRYEMENGDAPLAINGIVYNEMKGVYGNIYNVAYQNLTRTLFPDTYQSRDSGGDPACIPDLAYDDLLAFYDECYHPSNSATVFYGDTDIASLLKLMNDGYFSQTEAREPAAISKGQAAFETPVKADFAFPAAADAEQTGAVCYLGFALPQEALSAYRDYAAWYVMTDYLSDESTPLMQALNQSGIGSAYGSYVDRLGTQLVISFYADDADEARADEFESIVLEQLSGMARDGLNDEMLRALFARKELEQKLQRNTANVAMNVFENLTYALETGDLSCFDGETAFQEADGLVTPAYAAGMLQTQLVDNPSRALACTVPEAGLLEKNEEALTEKLAAQREAMTAEQRAQIVADTASFNQWLTLTTPEETLEKLDVVDPQTVESIRKDRRLQTLRENGYTVLLADGDTDVAGVNIWFDISGLSLQEQHLLKMALSLYGNATAAHTQEEITIQSARLLNAPGAYVTTLHTGGGYQTVLCLAFNAPKAQFRQGAELALEMLAEPLISDNRELLLRNIQSAQTGFSNVESVYGGFLTDAALAGFNPINAANLRLNGMAYLDALQEAEAACQADGDGFVKTVEAALAKALHQEGVTLLLVGDDTGECRKALEEVLSAKLSAVPADGEAAAQLTAGRSVAYTGNTSADYLVKAMPLGALGGEVSGAQMVLCSMVRGDYLLPELRFKGGAYSADIDLSISGNMTLYLYRSPDYLSALEVIAGIPDFLKSLSLTQEQLDNYKLPLISSCTVSGGELNDGLEELELSLMGFTPEKRAELVREIRAVTVEDILALIPTMERFVKESALAVVTTAEKAALYEGGFDEVVKLP